MRYRHLPHTDLSKKPAFQDDLNNLAMERRRAMIADKRRAHLAAFRQFLTSISHHDKNTQLRYCHFWRWVNAQVWKRRTYTYIDVMEEVSEILIVTEVTPEYIGYTTKSGKKKWKDHIFTSPFFRHWAKANRI